MSRLKRLVRVWWSKGAWDGERKASMSQARLANLCVTDTDGSKRYLVNEVNRLCDRVLWCQASRSNGDLDADLDALEQQRCVVERILAQLEETSDE